MTVGLLVLGSFLCSWFQLQCEIGKQPESSYLENGRMKAASRSLELASLDKRENDLEFMGMGKGEPLVFTKLGGIMGRKMKIATSREIFAFTGVPYAERPQRFKAPVPKKPWRKILKADSPSPFCVQLHPLGMGAFQGVEDCLKLDIYTPKITKDPESAGLPVMLFFPGGANIFGTSQSYGPSYLLDNDDIVLVVVNVRHGIFGYLATGDEASPGNYGLKDAAQAVEFVHDHISAFGGNPNKITVSGISSGGATAGLFRFMNHTAKDHVKGIISIGSSVFANSALDSLGRVKYVSDLISSAVGCPTSKEGKSKEMVECLRRMDAYRLAKGQRVALYRLPPLSLNFGPTLEPDVPGALITQLPETMYEENKVAPIPMIISKAEDEAGIFMTPLRYNVLPRVIMSWYDMMPLMFKVGLRPKNNSASENINHSSLLEVGRFYFNKTTPPRVLNRKEFSAFVSMISDVSFNAPFWKDVQSHHSVAPTYAYMFRLTTHDLNTRLDRILKSMNPDITTAHGADVFLLFNFQKIISPQLVLPKGPEIASKNFINMIVNFVKYGKPLYRTPNGTLLPLWRPIQDMRNPLMLDVGLIHNISMIRDPLVGTDRLKIWENLKF